MINFNVYEFCKNCSYFEAKTSVIYANGTNTIFDLTCVNRLSCIHAYNAGVKDGIAEASKDKDGKTNE